MGVAKPLLSHTAATPVADRSLEGHDRQALSLNPPMFLGFGVGRNAGMPSCCWRIDLV